MALYASLPDEVDTWAMLDLALRETGEAYLPRVAAGSRVLDFYRVTGTAALVASRLGIREPHPEGSGAPLSPELLDFIVVPVVAFDAACRRLGRGGGYYDATLPRCRAALSVGLAYECQHAERIPEHPGDWPLDMVVSEWRIYRNPPYRAGTPSCTCPLPAP